MVKPTLKPEPEKEKKEDNLKDDKLKEWGVLPATVVIDETEKESDKKDAEAAMSNEYMTDVAVGSRPSFVKCCACIAVLTLLLIITCTIGSFLYFSYGSSEHKWKGWCSVKYGDDDSSSSEEKGRHEGYHGDGNHGNGDRRHPYGNDALYPPTGPPRPHGRTCNQESQVDLDNRLERIDRPHDQDCERLTILHDYTKNISAYRLWQSEICYITSIDPEILMNPEEFWTNMQDPAYLNQWFEELKLTYYAVPPAIPTPLHEQENGKYGEYLDGPKEYLCQGATTYWIEQVSEEELEEFLKMIEQIVQEFMALAAAYESEVEGGNQPHHGRHDDLPQPMPEDGMPWEDFMPLGNPGEEGWPVEEWAGRHHEGMQEWPMGERPEGHEWPAGERPEWPMHERPEGHHGPGHHGGHHGGHDEGHDGHRQRRGILDGGLKGIKDQIKNKAKAKKYKKCVAESVNKYKQIVGNGKVNVAKIIPDCLMEEYRKRTGEMN